MSRTVYPLRSLRFALAGLVLPWLAACQFYAPNAPVDPVSTEAITQAEAARLWQRGPSPSVSASQIRIATGGLTRAEVCVDWLDPCWEEKGIVAPVAPAPDLPQLPQVATPAVAQTFRGVLPCLETGDACIGQQAVLTLFANQAWRARVSVISPDGSVRDPMPLAGCWSRDPMSPRHFVLRLGNGNLLVQLDATSNNQLRVRADPGTQGANFEAALRYHLTRQPQVDWLGEAIPAGPQCRQL
ncbi:MAG: hypothetical protein AB7E55_04405 [Pigmentiphaga sp.]